MNASDPSAIVVRAADLSDLGDARAVTAMLDAYARDPLGMEAPLPEQVKSVLTDRLREVPHWIAVAWKGTAPVGIAVCFPGFSTFRARPLLNLHDFAVVPEARGSGAGKALMQAVLEEARRRGSCKVTLEVRSDNDRAKRLYAAAGFTAYDDGSGASFEFWKRELE